jgi:hypothetical protein
VVESQDMPFALVHDLLRVLGAPASAPSAEQDALVAAIVAAIDQRPLLLVVDDLHDADAWSARALAAAVGRTADLPVASVVAHAIVGARRGAAPTSWPSLALGALADDASRAVVRATLGPTASEAVVAAVVGRVGGTPGALVAAARSLTRAQATGAQPLPAVLPVGAELEAAWSRVLDELPTGAREALLVLAVVGSEQPDLLAATMAECGLQGSDLVAAEARGLARCPAPGRVDMRDRVLAAVLLGSADAGEVRRLHALAADIGAGVGADPSAVTHHLARSTVVPDSAVADALAQQARRCTARGRVAEAALALEAAAMLTPDPSMRRARATAAVRDRIETGIDVTSARDLLGLVGPGRVPSDDVGWVHWLEVLAQPDLPSQLEAALAGVAAARTAGQSGLVRALLWEAIESAWLLGRADVGLALAQQYAEMRSGDATTDREEPEWAADALMSVALTQVGRLTEAAQLRKDALARADTLDSQACALTLLLDAVALDDALQADTRERTCG